MTTTPNYSLATTIWLAVSLTCCGFCKGLVSGTSQAFTSGRTLSMRKRNRPTRIGIHIDDITPITSIDIPSLPPSLQPSACVVALPSNIFCAASKMISSDPQLEAEILNDVSFVALDVPTFLSPNTAWLRFCNVAGRVLILCSEYVQDERLTPDEWLLQASMLAVSIHMLLRSVWPTLLAICSSTTLSVRDRKSYTLLFETVGLTILQFKTLLASSTLDWIEFAPNEAVELNGEYMYFLYSGKAEIPGSAGNSRSNFSRTNILGFSDELGEGLHVSTRIFGDIQFAKALEESASKKSKKNGRSVKKTRKVTANPINRRRGGFVVGASGATLLRISTRKLLKLMKNDDELSVSIQRLVLLCMQEKLSRTLEENGLILLSTKNAPRPGNVPSSEFNVTNACQK